jgi:hypothetical protein
MIAYCWLKAKVGFVCQISITIIQRNYYGNANTAIHGWLGMPTLGAENGVHTAQIT